MRFERPPWPNGARCAVTLTFDNLGESYDLVRYGHAGGANADGVYAARRGVERVLDLLDRYEIPGTFFVEGWNARRYAALVGDIVCRGHEIAGHMWMHEEWSRLEAAQERDLLLRTTETLGEIVGQTPRGWRSPMTTRTLRLLHAAGYRYDSSFGDEDVPYLLGVDQTSTEEIVELPWTWTLDDAVYYAHPGTMRQPSEVIDLWIDEFNSAYAMTGNFMLVCHPRYSGRPARIQALERLIEHAKDRDGVWFARCDEVAEFIRSWDQAPRYQTPVSMADRIH